MYISEATSVAARLNASWALSVPAMSLVRNRYEHAVRISWLARQKDQLALRDFVASHYSKANKVFRNMTPSQLSAYVALHGQPDSWLTDVPTKAQRALLQRWQATPLSELVQARDKADAFGSTTLDGLTLAKFYNSIYRQFSSAAHLDGYALNLIGLHQSTDCMVLAPHPMWPSMLALHDALFCIIQCREALIAFYSADRTARFLELYDEWQGYSDELVAGYEQRPILKQVSAQLVGGFARRENCYANSRGDGVVAD
jgi:hypothetical protein